MDMTQKGVKRFMTNYRDHELEIGDKDGRPLSIMRVAVCVNCKALLTAGGKVQATADTILKNHKEYWNQHPEEFSSSGGQTFDFETFTVSDPSTDFSKHRKSKDDFEQKERETKQKKDEKTKKEDSKH